MAWLRDQRRSEPGSPAGLIAVVVVLALLVLGLGGGLPRLLGGNEPARPPIGLLTPAPGPADDPNATSALATPSVSTSSSTPAVPTTSPSVVTQRPSDQSTAAASRTANAWAHEFYRRSPANETYRQLVERAAKYTTRQVADSFAATGDSTYEALRSAGGTSRVLTAPVSNPRPGTAPVDTPSRITRLVTISVDVTGRNPARLKVPLLVTLVSERGHWVISDIDGGTGP